VANTNLGAARKAKQDGFYTQWADIERELNAYLEQNGGQSALSQLKNGVRFTYSGSTGLSAGRSKSNVGVRVDFYSLRRG